jgi:nitroreductase
VTDAGAVYRYHDGTKHHFHRFARSLGYLDWASQPSPFRSYVGAPEVRLQADTTTVADILRHSLGLSAWKQYERSRWSLRVNPSSGNLHPTEAYVIAAAGVFHYAPDRHALEQRCALELPWPDDAFLVALTSIHWREAWKYGERAFRYCQHDLGHAIAAVAIAASNAGLQARLLPEWSHADVAAITGVDRDEDFVEAEREEPGCIIAIGRQAGVGPAGVVQAFRPAGPWSGHASQLSEDHVEWTFIDEIAEATRWDARPSTLRRAQGSGRAATQRYARSLILQRRSALALDGQSSIALDRFLEILSHTIPSDRPPWSALWWDARIHLALFVHRVDGLEPGLYLIVRNDAALERLRSAVKRDFLWTRVTAELPLFALALGDCRRLAGRVSCDQEIAADGFFSLGMIADFDAALQQHGPAFYRQLFWESGLVGHVLYLEAERAGARGTGIGCFYDDPVHDVLGLTGHAFQSLYHFTIGMPVEDARLITESGYAWERAARTEERPPHPAVD